MTCSRPKSSGRKTKDVVAAEETERRISSTTSRVTRSRSRESAQPSAVSVPVSRRPRLDVQSEDEEEERLETQSVASTPQVVPVTWRKVSLEGRGLVAASLLLLVLLVVIHSLVSSLHSHSSLRDSLILGVAYALTPVRLVLETVRVILGPSHVHYSADSLDYDVLLDNILNSERFRQIVEKVSSDKLSSFELSLQDRIVTELSSVSDSKAHTSQSLQRNFEEEMAQTRRDFTAEIDKSFIELKQQLDLTGFEDRQNSKAIVLDAQITEMKLKLEEITRKLENSQHQPDEKLMVEIGELKDKLRALELNRDTTAEVISRCCKDNSKIDLVTSNKVEEMMKQLQVTLENKMITKTEFEAKMAETESKAEESLASYKTKIVEETKQEIETLMSSTVIDLKKNVEAEVVTVGSLNISESSVRPAVDVKKIVREALTKYDADKTGLFDFALETAGGSILSTKCTEPYQVTTGVLSVWGIPFWWDTNSPRTILQPGTSPGQCWAFRGSQGAVLVQLSSNIHITAVSIEHISSLLSPDGNIYSAPSHMSLSGVREEEAVTPLLNFTYSTSGEPVQTFWLAEPSRESWQLVELEVHNNHGHPDYTCLYRLRVHGNVGPDTLREH